jgi:hypothetical protein
MTANKTIHVDEFCWTDLIRRVRAMDNYHSLSPYGVTVAVAEICNSARAVVDSAATWDEATGQSTPVISPEPK